MSSFADNVANKFNEVENKVSQDLNNPDINSENFLFFIKPNEIDEDGVCGLDQKLTVRIISVIALFSAGCAFISSLGKDNIFSLLWDLFISVFFLIVAFYSFYSTINHNYNYTKIAYLLSTLIWFYSFIF